MNLILFRRCEIASSRRIVEKGEEKNGENNEPVNDAIDGGTGAGVSGSTTRYIVQLDRDVVKKNDPRIVHLTKHLKKTQDGDTFKVGIINGNKGTATIVWNQHESRLGGVLDVNKQPNEGNDSHLSTNDENDKKNPSRKRQRVDKTKVQAHDSDHTNTSNAKKSSKSSSSSDSSSKSHALVDVSLVLDFDPMKLRRRPVTTVTVVLSLPFPKRLKYLWSQMSSFGCVGRICIVRGMLSDPQYIKSSCLAVNSYEPLIMEGSSQGCHTRTVRVDIKVDQILNQDVLHQLNFVEDGNTASDNGDDVNNNNKAFGRSELTKLFLDCGDDDDDDAKSSPGRRTVISLLSALEHHNKTKNADEVTHREIIIAIGSERGWTEDEAQLFAKNGFQSVTLGSSILRVDTAVVAALGIISSALEDNQQEKIS